MIVLIFSQWLQCSMLLPVICGSLNSRRFKKLSKLTCKWRLIYIPLVFICEGVKWESPSGKSRSHLKAFDKIFECDWSILLVLGGSVKGGHLTPSQMRIKWIQIKLDLQVSSLNFLIPSHFICLGLIKTLKNHIQISQFYLLSCIIVTTLNLIYYLHEVYIIICIINYFFFIMFLKSFHILPTVFWMF